MPEQPSNETAPSLVTVEQVHEEFEKLLKDRAHMGVRNFLGDAFLEPRNPFEQERRSLQKWVVVVGVLFLLSLLIVYSLHTR